MEFSPWKLPCPLKHLKTKSKVTNWHSKQEELPAKIYYLLLQGSSSIMSIEMHLINFGRKDKVYVYCLNKKV